VQRLRANCLHSQASIIKHYVIWY